MAIPKIRKQVNIGTFLRVRKHFEDNRYEEFTTTSIRDELKIDYLSVKLILQILVADKTIKKTDNKYKMR